jgi:hypothetical protein
MGAEAVGEAGDAGDALSSLPEGLEREEDEDKEDHKERLKLALGDEPTKANIEMLQRVKPRLTWNDLKYIFTLSVPSLKNIVSGKREGVPKKKSGRKGKK